MSARILAVETSNNRTSLALRIGDATVFHAICDVRDNIGWLRQMLTAALQQHAITMADLTLLAVTHGPGGMTGVRVGVGFVQGLALAASKPVAAVNTLSVMGWAAQQRIQRPAGRLSVALDARMGEIYVADWAADASPQELLVVADRVSTRVDEFARAGLRHVAGPGWEIATVNELADGMERVPGIVPDAADLACLAAYAHPLDAREVQVHYLRNRVAEVPARLRESP